MTSAGVPPGRVPGLWVPDWNTHGPFLPLVNTYTAALSSIAVLADPELQLPVNPYLVNYRGRALDLIALDVTRSRGRFIGSLTGGTAEVQHLFQSLTCMLINAAYEAVREQFEGNPHALWQFFRHVRNGCSHGNSFSFDSSQPSKPASWRIFTIDHTRKGEANPLHGTPVFGVGSVGLLYEADALLLLADVEKEFLGGTGGRMTDPPATESGRA